MAACKTETSSSDPEYAVTYDANGADRGTVPSAGGKYTAGSTVSVCGNTGNLAKAGYTFAGWNTAADGTGTPYAAGGTFIMGNAAVTLYAEWAAGTGTVYTVQYWQQDVSDDNYTLADTENLTSTTGGAAAYTVKTYPGFTNDTALTTINGTVSTTGTIKADGSTVVKLYYTRNTITLTFDLAGGMTTTTFTATTDAGGTLTGRYGATVAMAAPVKTGYTFAGWNTPGGTLPAAFPAEDASYTATWTAGTGTVYTVQYLQQDISDNNYTIVASDTENLTGTTGASLTYTTSAKTYTGFTYDSSLTTINGTVSTTGTIKADGSTVVQLYYTRNIITLTFDLAGGTTTTVFTAATGTGGTLTGRYGAAVTMAAPAKTGYTFAGWNTSGGTLPKTFPASGASYSAKWTIDSYSITYVLDGGTNSTANPAGYNIETETITPASPSKTGYTFAGWYSDASFTKKVTQIASGSTGNVTLYAKWTTDNTAAITFVSGSMSVSVDGTTCTAVPPETGDWTYCWYFNGTQLSAAVSTCTINTAGLAPGYYELTVTTEIHGVTWLATCRVTVE